jgi:hypothetical protein
MCVLRADTPLVAWEELSTGEKASLAFIFLHNADPGAAFKLFAVVAERVIPPSGVGSLHLSGLLAISRM